MLVKQTPSKAPRTAEFQRTPGRLGSALCGSPALCESAKWVDAGAHSGSPPMMQLPPLPPTPVRPAPVRPATWCGFATPQHGRCTQVSTPLMGSSSTMGSSSPSYCPNAGVTGGPSPLGAALSGQRWTYTTPSKIISITTPLRPCSRQQLKDIVDDLNAAVAEQSVPLVKAALHRRHVCPGEHALHEAIRQAHVPALRLLLQSRAEPNGRCLSLERGCEFPLQLACCCTHFLQGRDRLEAVELLLQAGARPSPRRTDAEANTPLHDATRRGDFDIATALLRHGANPNVANGFGETPLHLLVRQDFVFPHDNVFPTLPMLMQMAEVLLRAGASPLVHDCRGALPIEHASTAGIRQLLGRWAAWWRVRILAWVHSRSEGNIFCWLLPEHLKAVAEYL